MSGPPPGPSRATATPDRPRVLPPETLAALAGAAFRGGEVLSVQPLTGGVVNSNYRVRLKYRHDPVVLRLYDRDPAACAKELELMRLVRGTVAVPDILHADPVGMEGVGPCLWLEHVHGLTVRQLKAEHDTAALASAARSIGQALAAIGEHAFVRPGWLRGARDVGAALADGEDPVPAFLDRCRASEAFRPRMEESLSTRLHEFAWAWAPRLRAHAAASRLVHGDFSSGNLVVREIRSGWRLVAVLDWECAVSGSPLADVGHFLRHELPDRPRLEPHFSRGFVEAGGGLPADWRELARLLDLAALCEMLTRESLPDFAVAEIRGLIRATVEG